MELLRMQEIACYRCSRPRIAEVEPFRLFSLKGRLTRSARRVKLHLPERWPWAIEFSTALARLRAIPLLA